MPGRKSALGLVELTVKQVAASLEIICYGCDANFANFKRLNERGEYLKFRSPLHILPSCLLSAVCQEVLWSRGVQPHILHILFIRNLTCCNLPARVSALPLAIQMLANNCANLTRFQLNCCKNLDGDLFCVLLKSCQNITHINTEGTSFNDSCLQQLTESNSRISYLNITRTNVTDKGVQLLSGEKLPCLSVLILLGCRVSCDTICHLVTNIPHLITLEHDSIMLALHSLRSQMEVFKTCASESIKSRLKKITVNNCSEQDSEVLAWGLPLFPDLEGLSLENSEPSAHLFHTLAERGKSSKSSSGSSRNLSQLEVGFSQLTASPSLFNSLHSLGVGLTHISLENVEDCDIISIGLICPNITHLKLSAFLLSPSASVPKNRMFEFLEELYIFNSRHSRVDSCTIKSVLGPRLKVAYLQNLDELNDDLFGKILTISRLAYIEALSFESCHNLGLKSVLRLFSSENLLESLHIWSCDMIGQIEQQIIEGCVEKYNFNLNFQWQGGTSDVEEFENPQILRDLLLPLLGVHILPEL